MSSGAESTRAGEESDTDSVAETLAEPVQAVTPEQVIADETEATEAATKIHESDPDKEPEGMRRRIRWSRVIAYGVLPGVALLLASVGGFLKWQDTSVRDAQLAGAQSVRAATDGTIALLSYRPESVQKDLEAARGRLTGTFLNAYTSLTRDVVIPGAKQKQISAVATIPGAASVSAAPNHAVVLLFVNQTVTVGEDAPTNSVSSVRVTLDKINGRWLISAFDPV